MNAGLTSERVYDALRRQILGNGFRPGERLDPASLADTLASSVTPVRDALHRLVGERLVETAVSEGFHVPHVTLPGLQDLYRWSGQVLLLALRDWPADVAQVAAADLPPARIEDAASCLFDAVAARSGNVEHAATVGATSARLEAARQVEGLVLIGVADEIEQLAHSLRTNDRIGLRRQIERYHGRRRRSAAEIIRLLYRSAPPV